MSDPQTDEPGEQQLDDLDLETPEADALEQHTDVERTVGPLRHIDRDLETPEADAIDQHLEVPSDPDER